MYWNLDKDSTALFQPCWQQQVKKKKKNKKMEQGLGWKLRRQTKERERERETYVTTSAVRPLVEKRK